MIPAVVACANPTKGMSAKVFALRMKQCADERGIRLNEAAINYEKIRQMYGARS